MSNAAPITLEQLFRFYRGLPHQAAAIGELEDDLAANGYEKAMRRDRPWFKTWSTDGKQQDQLVIMAQATAVFGRAPTTAQLSDLNDCLQRFSINTPARIRHFLAQIAHESGGLRWMEELADGSAYEGRADLGNTQPGDGPRFKGAGALQLTGRHNYQQLATALGDPRVMKGCAYVAARYPFTSAGFWWQQNGMNALVDAGATCRKISAKVNGRDPANDLADREAYYAKANVAIPSKTLLPALNVPAQQPAVVRPTSPFTTHLTPSFTLGEFALQQESRRFVHQYQVDTAAELAGFLERVRRNMGNKPIVITSGYRPAAINASVGGASGSEHLYDGPGVGAVDFYVDGADINVVQAFCDRYWDYSVGYGASKGFVHLGIRRGRPRVRWDY